MEPILWEKFLWFSSIVGENIDGASFDGEYSVLPTLFAPTNEANHTKFSHKIGANPTNEEKGFSSKVNQ